VNEGRGLTGYSDPKRKIPDAPGASPRRYGAPLAITTDYLSAIIPDISSPQGAAVTIDIGCYSRTGNTEESQCAPSPRGGLVAQEGGGSLPLISVHMVHPHRNRGMPTRRGRPKAVPQERQIHRNFRNQQNTSRSETSRFVEKICTHSGALP